jgi:DNA polymerase III subunit delta'
MAEEPEDPREVPWHPRFAAEVKGHSSCLKQFSEAFTAGRPHHAWLLTGPMGIGKATLAYKLAAHVLASGANEAQAKRWITSRAHPDFGLLERSFNDSKPKRLRSEISVEDVRRFSGFFERTASIGGWKVGLVDCVDDLNSESANALLKLVEEPPVKSLLLLICHNPGKALRTLRSRCLRLPLNALSEAETSTIVANLPLEPKPSAEAQARAARLSNGSPGLALQLLNSTGAKAFDQYVASTRRNAGLHSSIASQFSTRAAAVADFDVFMDLLLDWLAGQAAHHASRRLADLHSQLTLKASIAKGYNLDRRIAVLETLTLLEEALNAALKAA